MTDQHPRHGGTSRIDRAIASAFAAVAGGPVG
jgi:hypothetical protein